MRVHLTVKLDMTDEDAARYAKVEKLTWWDNSIMAPELAQHIASIVEHNIIHGQAGEYAKVTVRYSGHEVT